MSWKEQLNRAIDGLKGATESESARRFAARAKETAQALARRAKAGALDAADAFVQANSDPSALKVRFLNADVNVVSPSDGIEITRPSAGSLVISDGEGNALVINAAAEKAFVAETIGDAKRLERGTYDLGPEDGINVVVIKG